MFLEPEELTALLREEDSYISSLLNKWQQKELPADTEHKLRIGKRLELLGDLQSKKEAPVNQQVESLRDLVRHMWIHSGHKDCGYEQMSGVQKSLYEGIVRHGGRC